MDYDLTKLLKDAGFPKESFTLLISTGNGPKGQYTPEQLEKGEWYDIPNLRELIHACGERFSQITQLPPIIDDPKKWIAHAWMGMEKSPSQITAMGETPEEAVALLWLELNKDTNVKASGYGTEGSGKG